MLDFERQLIEMVLAHSASLFAWNVFPNHYHLLVSTWDVKRLLHELGQLHGRTAFEWNGEDARRSRKVWCNAAETAMKSEGHFWASLNYVLHNVVRHGYVQRWQEWPYSNAEQYLEQVGRETAPPLARVPAVRLWQRVGPAGLLPGRWSSRFSVPGRPCRPANRTR